jgi:hypothetical protein
MRNPELELSQSQEIFDSKLKRLPKFVGPVHTPLGQFEVNSFSNTLKKLLVCVRLPNCEHQA